MPEGRTRYFSPLLTGVLAGITLACAPKPTDTSADEAAIHALVQSFNDHLKAQNDSALAEMYAADAVLLSPNLPRVTGTVNIRRFWAQIWPLKATLVIQPEKVRVSGDRAVEAGSGTWSVPASTGEQRDSGRYLVSWRNVDGKWPIAQGMWSSDNPPPPSPASPPAAS